MYEFAVLAGALVPALFIPWLLHATSRAWPLTVGKAIQINAVALVIIILLSAIGHADGGPPNFGTTPIYVAAQAVALVLWVIAARRGRPASI